MTEKDVEALSSPLSLLPWCYLSRQRQRKRGDCTNFEFRTSAPPFERGEENCFRMLRRRTMRMEDGTEAEREWCRLATTGVGATGGLVGGGPVRG
jgi:hypothetical protein